VGEPACDLLDAELALDRIEAELVAELPAHVRAFAAAHVRGDPPPASPVVLRSERAITAARHGCMHELLADRGRALLRLVAPTVIESDPEVARLRGESPSWPGLQRLAVARDVVARARFGEPAIALLHRLHGVTAPPIGAKDIPELPGWLAEDTSAPPADIDAAWQRIARRYGVSGTVRIERASTAPPRTFVVVPAREVIVVVPAALDRPTDRFVVLHELGHAVAALACPVMLPRVLDEAVAALVARLAETDELGAAWRSVLAAAARDRRLAIAATFDAIERRLPALPETLPASRPPAALWHDPGAQAAYVEAEVVAGELARDTRPLGDVLAERLAR
jgi:hypothetical protein